MGYLFCQCFTRRRGLRIVCDGVFLFQNKRRLSFTPSRLRFPRKSRRLCGGIQAPSRACCGSASPNRTRPAPGCNPGFWECGNSPVCPAMPRPAPASRLRRLSENRARACLPSRRRRPAACAFALDVYGRTPAPKKFQRLCANCLSRTADKTISAAFCGNCWIRT